MLLYCLYKQTVGGFSQFFEHSDICIHMSEHAMQASLWIHMSISGAEKQEKETCLRYRQYK